MILTYLVFGRKIEGQKPNYMWEYLVGLSTKMFSGPALFVLHLEQS
uniref:Uncharacterized protein n=1 Tax=Rhizophora mucronata TaxID=61149 RepID=A0A2P2NXS5_RHIMU